MRSISQKKKNKTQDNAPQMLPACRIQKQPDFSLPGKTGSLIFCTNSMTEQHLGQYPARPRVSTASLPAGHHRGCHSGTCPEVACQATWPAGSPGAQRICPRQLAWPEPAHQQGWQPGSGSKKEVSPAGTCGAVTSSSLPGPSWPVAWAGVGRTNLPRQEREAGQLFPGCLDPGKNGLAQQASASTVPGTYVLKERVLHAGVALRAHR